MIKKALLFPYVFAAMNWAVVAGLACFLRGSGDIWQRPQPVLRTHQGPPETWA